jgi:DNA-binding MarR family transcriptional regulator
MHTDHVLKKAVDTNLSHAEFLYVYTVYTWGEMGPAEITRRLGVSKAAATNILNSLIRKGHIDRVPSPADARRMNVTLTQQGRQVVKRWLQFAEETKAVATKGFTDEESEQLWNFLHRMIDNFREYNHEIKGAKLPDA